MAPVVIGNATLYLGDCLEILPSLPKVDAVITDPPYNVGKIYGLHDDSMADSAYLEWCAARVRAARAIADNQFWVAPRYKMSLWISLLPEAHIIVIRRGAAGPFRGGWLDQFETALSVGKPAHVMSDCWDDIRLMGEGYFFREETYGHPGYTPYRIMERAISLLAQHSLCDPFMGTGTSGEAAIKTGRKFIGIEIEPKYFNIACERIENAQRQLRMFA
jgi:DNA modification methylase